MRYQNRWSHIRQTRKIKTHFMVNFNNYLIFYISVLLKVNMTKYLQQESLIQNLAKPVTF